MPADTLAFAAGVLDARGHISLVERHGLVTPRVRVTTARTELLEWLAHRTGTTVRHAGSPYRRRGCSEHCQQAHIHTVRNSAYWNADGERAQIILSAALPWFVQARRPALDALRASAEIRRTRRTEIGALMCRLGWPAYDGRFLQVAPEPARNREGGP